MAAKKKSGTKKKRTARGKKTQKWKFNPLWFGIGAFGALTLCAALYVIFLHQPARHIQGGVTKEYHPGDKGMHIPEEPGAPEILEPLLPKQKPLPGAKPRVAIVIDDMGYRLDEAEKLLSLDLELSFAFLPHGPHTQDLAREARQRGRDILLHFPMEPNNAKVKVGPGAVDINMTSRQIAKRFKENMTSVPWAIGVNNHMGSRFTQNRRAMEDFMELVQQNKMFFLDSATSANSIGQFVAGEMGVKSARRNIFLDNNHTIRDVNVQLEKLVRYAEVHHSAIGIGHPTEATYAALAGFKKLYGQRVKVVGVHALIQ